MGFIMVANNIKLGLALMGNNFQYGEPEARVKIKRKVIAIHKHMKICVGFVSCKLYILRETYKE